MSKPTQTEEYTNGADEEDNFPLFGDEEEMDDELKEDLTSVPLEFLLTMDKDEQEEDADKLSD
jgi:hypothetical protein